MSEHTKGSKGQPATFADGRFDIHLPEGIASPFCLVRTSPTSAIFDLRIWCLDVLRGSWWCLAVRMYIGDLQITAGESGFTGLLVLAPDKNSVLQAEKPGSF